MGRAEERTQLVRALGALVDDPGLGPKWHLKPSEPLTPKDLVLPFDLSRHCMHVAHMTMCRATPIRVKFLKSILKTKMGRGLIVFFIVTNVMTERENIKSPKGNQGRN